MMDYHHSTYLADMTFFFKDEGAVSEVDVSIWTCGRWKRCVSASLLQYAHIHTEAPSPKQQKTDDQKTKLAKND